MNEPVSQSALNRAEQLIYAGYPLEQVARMVGVSRVSLYRHGLRSRRGYEKRSGV